MMEKSYQMVLLMLLLLMKSGSNILSGRGLALLPSPLLLLLLLCPFTEDFSSTPARLNGPAFLKFFPV